MYAEHVGGAAQLLVTDGPQLAGAQLERALVVVGGADERDVVARAGELRDRPAGEELHVVPVRLEHQDALHRHPFYGSRR